MATFGNPCVDQGYYSGSGDTIIDVTNPAGTPGILTQVCVYIASGGTISNDLAKIKIFRLNGSNYDFIGESSGQALVVGVNTFSGLSISIQTGDYIGYYKIYNGADSTGLASGVTAGTKKTYFDSDITTNTPTSSWESNTTTISILATYTITSSDDVYVDINKSDDSLDGSSFANAKKTMKAGWDILNATGTMHVASGNYSAQATIAYNKSWTLSPEDPNSTGEKKVTIPKST